MVRFWICFEVETKVFVERVVMLCERKKRISVNARIKNSGINIDPLSGRIPHSEQLSL